IVGITPEAPTLQDALGPRPDAVPRRNISRAELRDTHASLNTSESQSVGVVAFGNPHFSLTELERLANLCGGLVLADGVSLMVTCGREIHRRGLEKGFVQRIEDAGGTFITDTC